MTYQNESVPGVDDTPANFDLLFDQLKKHQIQVLVAKSGPYEQVQCIKPNEAVLSEQVDYITKPTVKAEVQASIQTHLTMRERPCQLCQQEELLRANRALQEEITRRKQNEQEKNRLLTMFEQQSDQLSALTNLLMKSQQKQCLELDQTGHQQVLDNLSLANSSLDFIDQALSSQTSPALIQCHIKHLREALQRVEDNLKTIPLSSERQEKRRLRESSLLKLTAREREVLQLVVEGKSTAEIASQLKLSKKSVTTYRGRIVKKLGLTDVTELIGFALKHGLTDMAS